MLCKMLVYDIVEEYLLLYCGDMNKFWECLKNLLVIVYFFLLLIRICFDCFLICFCFVFEGVVY